MKHRRYFLKTLLGVVAAGPAVVESLAAVEVPQCPIQIHRISGHDFTYSEDELIRMLEERYFIPAALEWERQHVEHMKMLLGDRW